MKQKVLVKTRNVIEVNKLVHKLLHRPRTEIPGLAVVYGPTGYGKTRWSEITAFQSGWGYMRIKRLQREKAFLQELYKRIYFLVNKDEPDVRGHASTLEDKCIRLLQDNPDIVMFIDEINHKIHKKEWDVLEIIRDLTDRSFATFVMIGEQDTYDALTNYNPHFLGRCNFLYKFQKNTLDDVIRIFDEVAEKPVNMQIIEDIYKETEGDLRKVVSFIPDIESELEM